MSKSSFYKTTATPDEMIAVATSASNAATSATQAATSASNASTSETNASNSASTATTKASEASTSATNAANSASTATTQATTATTQATNAANSATSASNSATSATNSATSATNSATSATNSATSATNSATSATNSASTATTKASEASTSATNAATSESNASTSATNASNSASTATTKASEASTSATNAATSASTATTKASEASTSATNASNSASTATTKASEASTSATNASNSASAAATSAANAASSFDNFDDRYLGTKSSDPSVDNDGNALVTGALYFSSSSNVMKVYDGGSWIAATSAGTSSLNIFKYVVSSGTQSTFSGSDSNNATLTYTVANIIVTLNGVVLDASDFTASNGTSIVLGSNAVTNDEVVIYAFKTFEVANALSLATGGTVAGNTTFNGSLTGTLTGNADTATTATNVTATANNSADETVYPTFVDGATGSQGIETDTGLNYNPSTGNLTSTQLTGTLQTASQPNITSVGTLTSATVSGDLTVDSSTFKIDSSNNRLGVGTASPAFNTEISNSSTSTSLTGLTDAQLVLVNTGTATANQFTKIGFRFADGTYNGQAMIAGVRESATSRATALALYSAPSSDGDPDERIRINSSGNVGIGTTSPTSPLGANFKVLDINSGVWGGTVNFSGNSGGYIGNRHSGNTGLGYYAASGQGHHFAVNGSTTAVTTINSDGRVGIGAVGESGVQLEINAPTTIPISMRTDGGNGNNRRCNLNAYASGNGTYGGGFILETRNNSNVFSEAMRVDFSGAMFLQNVYDDTTSFGANMYIHSDGVHQVLRSTSSERYKKNIETLEDKYADAVLGLRPVWYKSKCEADNPDYSHWGLIAEEVAKVDPRLVTFRTEITKRYRDLKTEEEVVETTKLDEPQAESVQYERFIPHLINICKRQEDKITALEAKVKALEEA